jgi:hypothetical protein
MPGATIENLGGSALTGLITAKSTAERQGTRMRRHFMDFIFPIWPFDYNIFNTTPIEDLPLALVASKKHLVDLAVQVGEFAVGL